MMDYKNHWDRVYTKSELNTLGWYEDKPAPSLELIKSCNLTNGSKILDVGSGTTTLIKHLINESKYEIYATDISKVALERAKLNLGNEGVKKINWIVDDITKPEKLFNIEEVDLWHDRTVLHFLVNEDQQKGYLKTLRRLVKRNGFVIIAVFSLEGAKKCSGLDVKNYDHNMIEEFLGQDFSLIRHKPFMYTMPSGDHRPYTYTLFKRI